MSLSWFFPVAGTLAYELASSELSGTFQNCTQVISLKLRNAKRCLITMLYCIPVGDKYISNAFFFPFYVQKNNNKLMNGNITKRNYKYQNLISKQ